MKIGISINVFDGGYGRYGENIYSKVREQGFSAVDFSMADTNSLLYTIEQKDIQKIIIHHRQLAENAGIEVSQVHGPWRYPSKNHEIYDRNEFMEKMKKSMIFTSLLNCKNWVVHPLIPYGTDDAETDNAKRTYEINYQFMKELIKTAKDYGITICLENMPWRKFSLAKPENVLKLVKDIKDDNFKICLDTGHANIIPDLNLSDEVKRLGKYIKAIHVHDNFGKSDMHLMPFFGTVNFKSFAHALKDIGFSGVFSLETAPPSDLPTYIFEDLSKSLCNIAEYIVK